MKLNNDYTQEEVTLLCNALMDNTLSNYDKAKELFKSENQNIETWKKIQNYFETSHALNDLSGKILEDIGVDE